MPNPQAITNAINSLIGQRAAALTAYKKLLSEPDSYSIQGSVSATNKKLSDLRLEIESIDSKLKSLLSRQDDGISRRFPNYNNGGY